MKKCSNLIGVPIHWCSNWQVLVNFIIMLEMKKKMMMKANITLLTNLLYSNEANILLQ